MRYRLFLLVPLAALLFSAASFAVELALIPSGFPAAQKPAFVKERAALVIEKQTLDAKVARYNKQCSHPKEYQAHKCNTERLALFQMVDAFKLKTADFNKRLGMIDRGLVKKVDDQDHAKDN